MTIRMETKNYAKVNLLRKKSYLIKFIMSQSAMKWERFKFLKSVANC